MSAGGGPPVVSTSTTTQDIDLSGCAGISLRLRSGLRFRFPDRRLLGYSTEGISTRASNDGMAAVVPATSSHCPNRRGGTPSCPQTSLPPCARPQFAAPPADCRCGRSEIDDICRTILEKLRRAISEKRVLRLAVNSTGDSGPRIVSLNGTRHAARSAATAHELSTIERDHCSSRRHESILTLQKIAAAFTILNPVFSISSSVASFRVYDKTSPGRTAKKVASRRPLLPFLHDSPLPTAKYWLHAQIRTHRVRGNSRAFRA